jgi:O-antigen ligase
MALALFFVVSGTGWSDVTGLLGRSSEMSGRVVIWAQATELIAARPVLGWGFDENARVIELTGLPYFQFHNGYLDVLVRGGAIAATVLFVLAARGLRALGRATVQHGPFPDVGVVCYPFLVALAIQNITEVSFLRARNVPWMLALFVIYWAAIVAARRQEPTRSPVRFEPCATPTVADEGGVRA